MARQQYTRPIIYQALLTLVLLAVGFLVAGGGISFAAPQYSLTCSSCHGMPPADSPTGTRDPDTRAVKGNHQDHLPSGVPAEGCVICHGSAVSSYPTGHRDAVIQMSSNVNSSPATGTYSRGTFFNQTSASLATLGTCASVNCHFESTTPAWGTTDFASPADCNRCHGAAPNTGSHPVSGAKHANYYGTTTSSCVKCHPSHAAEAKPFAHATSASQRNIILSFAAFPNNGSGSYSGPLNDYLPSQVNTFGGCSALYCHSPGDKASAYNAPNQAATWGASLGANCTGCHKGDKVSLDAMASGVHTKHVNSYIFPCQNCHSVTVSSGNRTLFANYTAHVNRSVNIAYASGIHVGGTYNGTASPMQKAPGSAVGSCANIYCHSDGTKAPAAGPFAPRVTPSWTAGALDATCSGCHLGDATAFKPMSTASHYKHVKRYTFNCVNCHSVTLQSGSRTLFANNTAHVNRSVNVAFDAAYYGTAGSYNGVASPMQKAPGSASGNCANIYCHSEGRSTSAPFKAYSTPKWGGTLPAKCTGCHGGDATTFKNISTGRHKAHMNNTGVLGLGNNFKCGDCHLKTVNTTSNTVITGQSFHVNTLKDYSGARAGRIGTFSGQITCGNNYCHSSGQAAPAFRNMTGGKRWSATGALDCRGCHGYGTGAFTPVAGEPNYSGSNSHQKHTVDAGMADSRGCANCHRVTVDKGVANKLKNYSSAHLNRVRDVAFSVFSNKTGHYTSGAKTCGNTYCHGAGNSPAWGSAGPLACNTCHSANNVLAGAHGQHWETATPPTSYTATPGNGSASGATYEFACSSCHQATHAGGSATAFGDAQVQFGYSSATRRGTYTHAGSTAGTDNGYKWTAGTSGACATTYCHSDGRGGNPVNTTFAWNTANGTLRCTGCHGGTMTLTSGKHQAHVNNAAVLDTNFGCADCHAKTVFTNNTTLGDKRKHVNKFRDYSGVKAGTITVASEQCSNVYCHSSGQAQPVFRSMTGSKRWTSGTATFACDACHGYQGSLFGAPSYANVSSATQNDFNSHNGKHIAAATDCATCHKATVGKALSGGFALISSPTKVHIDKNRNVAFDTAKAGGSASYDNGAKRCSSVTCHSNGRGTYQNPRWGAVSDCGFCHKISALSGAHKYHVYTSASYLPTTYNNFTANRTQANRKDYYFGCSNCHPLSNANHANGTIDIDLRPAGGGALKAKNSATIITGQGVPGGAGTGTYGASGTSIRCSGVYCHGNGGYTGRVAAFKNVTSPDWYGTYTGDKCAMCHGNAPNTKPTRQPGSPAHYNRNWLGFANVSGGHGVAIHYKNVYTGNNQNGLLPAGTGSQTTHGSTGGGYNTTISCNACHNATITTSANDKGLMCAKCHNGATAGYKNPAGGDMQLIANPSRHVNGTVEVVFNLTGFKSKAQVRDNSRKFAPYSTSWGRVDAYKSSIGYDQNKGLLVPSYSGGSCANIACHNGVSGLSWGATGGATSCQSCHTSL